ncbi:glycosyltransferase [Amylibacter sp.]|nr:glycosyltransferase [Amylibacter sp.]
MKLLSIIIRTKNEEQWLKATLTAVRSQSYKNIEIILVDNKSVDKTVETARRMGVTKIISLKHYNPSKALNMGVEIASGEICVFLSAHCVPVNDEWLAELCYPILAGEVRCAYGRQIPTSRSNADNARDLLITFGKERVVQESDFKFHNANSAIETKFIEKIPFDETLTNIEDWHWASNIINLGHSIAYVPTALVFHHHGLHQHTDATESFRAKPVAKLLLDAYRLDDNQEPFFSHENWDGLAILSNFDNENIEENISDLPTKYTILNNQSTKYNITDAITSRAVDKEQNFFVFLQNMLSYAEEEFDKIFDYVIFVDFAYQHLATQFAYQNVSQLFNYWADVASVGRKITGKHMLYSLEEECTVSEIFPSHASESKKIELALGQCGAIRTSVLRSCTPKYVNYRITGIINHFEAYKI